jgi:hypothetical protein
MSMVKMIGDYMKFVSFLDNVPLFNMESFFATKVPKEKEFYEKLVESQNFNFFLQQDLKEVFPYFYDLCMKKNNSIKKEPNKNRSRRSSFDQHDKKNLSVSMIYTGSDIRKSSFVEEFDEDDKDLFYEKRNLEYLETYKIDNACFKSNKFSSKQASNIKILMNGEINFDLPNPFAKTYNRYIIPDQEKDNFPGLSVIIEKKGEPIVNDQHEIINSARYEDSRRITIISRSRGVHISG